MNLKGKQKPGRKSHPSAPPAMRSLGPGDFYLLASSLTCSCAVAETFTFWELLYCIWTAAGTAPSAFACYFSAPKWKSLNGPEFIFKSKTEQASRGQIWRTIAYLTSSTHLPKKILRSFPFGKWETPCFKTAFVPFSQLKALSSSNLCLLICLGSGDR